MLAATAVGQLVKAGQPGLLGATAVAGQPGLDATALGAVQGLGLRAAGQPALLLANLQAAALPGQLAAHLQAVAALGFGPHLAQPDILANWQRLRAAGHGLVLGSRPAAAMAAGQPGLIAATAAELGLKAAGLAATPVGAARQPGLLAATAGQPGATAVEPGLTG